MQRRRTIRAKFSKKHLRLFPTHRAASATCICVVQTDHPESSGPLIERGLILHLPFSASTRKFRLSCHRRRSDFNRLATFVAGFHLRSLLAGVKQKLSFSFRPSPFPASGSLRAGLKVTWKRRNINQEVLTFLATYSVCPKTGGASIPSFPSGSASYFRTLEASTDFLKISVTFALLRRVGFPVLSSSGPQIKTEAKNVNRKSRFPLRSAAGFFRPCGASGRLD